MSNFSKIIVMGCILFFLFCAPKKTVVKTEGLEEVIVFGEEEKNVSEEPVYPAPTTPPAEVTPTTPPPAEEIPVLPPVTEEAPVIPPPPVVEEAPVLPPIEEVSVAPPPIPPAPTVPSAPTPPPAPTVAPSASPGNIYGFRVQIFASSTQKNASRVADDARSAFGGKVYIEYVPPYYKVRVGDCLTKEEAETLKNRALSLGYRGAFVVETMISP